MEEYTRKNREALLIEDKETKKSIEEKFIEDVIKSLEKYNINVGFALIAALGIWDVSSVKTEDGYVRKEDMGRIP